MKILTQFQTTVEGDNVTIKAKLVDAFAPPPVTQHTVMHVDDDNHMHISHLHLSNNGFFVRVPNKNIGVVLPAEEFVMNVARVIEPNLKPQEPKK